MHATNEDVSERAARVRDALATNPPAYARAIDDLEWLIGCARAHALALEHEHEQTRVLERPIGHARRRIFTRA